MGREVQFRSNVRQTGSCWTPTEVLAIVAALMKERADARSGHYMTTPHDT